MSANIWIIGSDDAALHVLRSLAGENCSVRQFSSPFSAKEEYLRLTSIFPNFSEELHVVFYGSAELVNIKTSPYIILRQWRATCHRLKIIVLPQTIEKWQEVADLLKPDEMITSLEIGSLLLALWKLYGGSMKRICGTAWAAKWAETGEGYTVYVALLSPVATSFIKPQLRKICQKVVPLPTPCSILDIYGRIAGDWLLYEGLEVIKNNPEIVKVYLRPMSEKQSEEVFLNTICQHNPEEAIRIMWQSPANAAGIIARGVCPEKTMYIPEAWKRLKSQPVSNGDTLSPGVLIIRWYEQINALINWLGRFLEAHNAQPMSIVIYDLGREMPENDIVHFQQAGLKDKLVIFHVTTPEELLQEVQFVLGLLHLFDQVSEHKM